ncbi:hypothetical protein E2C01_013723 [Portunus trituberculatus]|uniref:Uncharacterized protein n=1 Tax=Portunus trituberculatus TaxID=210409 RepID=A0A5B7DHY0_PORTR|nr:hypothetical protein [Portunus trituberculatus]
MRTGGAAAVEINLSPRFVAVFQHLEMALSIHPCRNVLESEGRCNTANCPHLTPSLSQLSFISTETDK